MDRLDCPASLSRNQPRLNPIPHINFTHKLEVGGLVVRWVYPIDLPYCLNLIDSPLIALTSSRLGACGPIGLPNRPTPLSRLDRLLLINLFALKLKVEGLWFDRSTRPTYPTISTRSAPAYKSLRSHKLEIGGLVVWSIYRSPDPPVPEPSSLDLRHFLTSFRARDGRLVIGLGFLYVWPKPILPPHINSGYHFYPL